MSRFLSFFNGKETRTPTNEAIIHHRNHHFRNKFIFLINISLMFIFAIGRSVKLSAFVKITSE
jgi:hypothetical protein